MKASVPILVLLGIMSISNLHAQGFLKKVKDKVSGKTETNSNDNSNNKTAETEKSKAAWCDTELGNGGAGAGAGSSNTSNSNSNVSYKLAFSSPTGFTILYDESCLGIGASKSDYRLILSQYVDKKTQYIIVDNGKITATVKEITNKELICGIHTSEGLNSGTSKTDNQKYIVPINTTTTIAAQDSKTITTAKKIDADKVATGYEMAKNTEEYKKLSPEEKKTDG